MFDITRTLSVKLTETELLERGQALSLKRREQREVEADKKKAAGDFKKRLDEIGAEIDRLAGIVREKAEPRPVPCDERRDYERNVIEIVRSDTGLVVETHVMTEAERQSLLFKDGPQAVTADDSAEDRKMKKEHAGKEAGDQLRRLAKHIKATVDGNLPMEQRFMHELEAVGDREGLSQAQLQARFRQFCRERGVRGEDRRAHLWQKVKPLLATNVPAPEAPAEAGAGA